jgi:hypothetical protein
VVLEFLATKLCGFFCVLQGNRMDELPERLIGSVRVSHLQLSSAVSPSLDNS